MPRFREAQLRYAAYYESVLQTARDIYLHDGNTAERALKLFNIEWGNIRTGQAWVDALREKDEEAAKLCSAYPNSGAYLFDLRRPPRERVRWLVHLGINSLRVRQQGPCLDKSI